MLMHRVSHLVLPLFAFALFRFPIQATLQPFSVTRLLQNIDKKRVFTYLMVKRLFVSLSMETLTLSDTFFLSDHQG